MRPVGRDSRGANGERHAAIILAAGDMRHSKAPTSRIAVIAGKGKKAARESAFRAPRPNADRLREERT